MSRCLASGTSTSLARNHLVKQWACAFVVHSSQSAACDTAAWCVAQAVRCAGPNAPGEHGQLLGPSPRVARVHQVPVGVRDLQRAHLVVQQQHRRQEVAAHCAAVGASRTPRHAPPAAANAHACPHAHLGADKVGHEYVLAEGGVAVRQLAARLLEGGVDAPHKLGLVVRDARAAVVGVVPLPVTGEQWGAGSAAQRCPPWITRGGGGRQSPLPAR